MKRLALLVLACSLLAASCRTSAPPAAPAKVPSRPFVTRDEMPDATRYLPPPPAPDSPAKAFDLARHEWGKSLRETDPDRVAQAAQDAVFTWENLFSTFSPAWGSEISEEKTPALCALLRFGLDSTRRAYRGVKDRYRRVRPFAELGETPLRPEDVRLGDDSYPSGHSATAWAAALILVEVSPASAEAVLDRAREAGESRVIAGVHWQSDVDAGRLVASAAFARLQSDPDFLALLEAARREAAAARR